MKYSWLLCYSVHKYFMFINNELVKIMNNIMNLPTAETQILERAIEALYQQTDLQLHTRAPAVRMDDRMIDAIIKVEGYEALRFTAEIKKWVQQKNIGAMQEQIRRLPGTGMLVADYVNPNMADKMREMNIPFIDAAGNAFINEKPLYVFIKGNKQGKITGVEQLGRAFNPTGIKVIHALLTNPGLINAPYREIHKAAGVAIGTIGWIFHDLKEAGFMVELHNKKRRLENKEKLIDRWVEAYLEKLRPKQLLGRFTTDNENWWKPVDLTVYGAKWGGETAAAAMTEYLRAEKFTIYLPPKGGEELFRDARFRKDELGDIAVYRAFWNEDKKHKKELKNLNENENLDEWGGWNEQMNLVDPLIVYADLIATADARNMETAKIIYGEKIAQLIDRD